MDQQNIDRLFREKLDQLEVVPSSNSWSLVEKQIRPKKTPIIYWVAASVSLLFISWVVWPVTNTQDLTPIASEITYPVNHGSPEFVLPVIDKKDKSVKKNIQEKQPIIQKKIQKAHKVHFATNNSQKSQEEIIEKVELIEPESKKMVATAEIEKPEITNSEAIEVEKPVFRTVKITYIASSDNKPVEVQKNDSTGALKKFIAFAGKIDPGDMLADMKTAKDNLLNGGLKNKKDRNSL
ncbi:hypothetical protein [Ekhidna sp.]